MSTSNTAPENQSQKPTLQTFRYVGIDVAKAVLDLCVEEGQVDQKNNSQRGHAEICREIGSRFGPGSGPPPLVVVEATGGLELPLVAALYQAGIAYRIVNPHRVREYAKSCGALAKTDRIDAQMLRSFGEALRLQPRNRPARCVEQLAALVQLREDHVAESTRWTNRLASLLAKGEDHAPAVVVRQMRQAIRTARQRIEVVDREIADHIEASDDLRVRRDILLQAKGIGPQTAAVLLALLPELGTLGPKGAACLTGTAPFAHDSGSHRGRRFCKGGRRPVRKALHMATLSAMVHDPIIRDFRKRLNEKGKSGMTVATACSRKLVVYLDYLLKPLPSNMLSGS